MDTGMIFIIQSILDRFDLGIGGNFCHVQNDMPASILRAAIRSRCAVGSSLFPGGPHLFQAYEIQRQPIYARTNYHHREDI